jgi:bacterioferritin
MKGNDKLIAELNLLLGEELTAINQYMVHAEMNGNWGYTRLEDLIEKRAVNEMKHAEKLIERILFLEGQPVVSKLNPIHIGQDVPKQIASDLKAELTAVKHYNEVVKLAADVGDYATQDILKGILNDEDDHVDVIEENQDQISQIGIQGYLSQQIKENGK